MDKKLIDYEGFEAYAKSVKDKYAKKTDLDGKVSKSDVVDEISYNPRNGKVVSEKSLYKELVSISQAVENSMNSTLERIPENLSQLTNDTKFKTETEIQEMIANSSKLKKEVVTTLPTTGKDDVIYLVKDTKGKDNNNYLEYLWIDGKWELIGSTQVDLSGYVKSEDIVEELCSSKNSELVANKKTYPFLDFLNRPVVMNNIEGNDWNTTAFTNGTRLYVSLDTKNAPNGDGAYIVFASYFLTKGNNESFSFIQISTTPVFVVVCHLNSGKMFFRKAYGGGDQKQIDEFTQGYTFSEWSDWKEITKDFAMKDDITKAISTLTTFKKEIVTSLPSAGKDNVFYLVKATNGKDNNNYLEYLWLNGKYELIGSTQVDLSGYAKQEDIVASKVVDKYVLTKDFRAALSGDQEFLKAVNRDMMTLVVFGGNDKMKFVSEAGFESILYYKGQVVGISLVPMDSQIDDGFVRGNNFDGGETYATSGLMKKYNEVIQRQFAELKLSQDSKLDKEKDKATISDVYNKTGSGKYVDGNLLAQFKTETFSEILMWISTNMKAPEEFTQQELEEAFK